MRTIFSFLVITMFLFGTLFLPTVASEYFDDIEFNELNGSNKVTMNSFQKPISLESSSSGRSIRSFEVPDKHIQHAISSMISGVSKPNLKNYVTTLQNFGSRLYRAPGMFNASIWLHDVLKGNGRLIPSYHNFTVVRPTWGTFNLSNVILTLPGVNQSSDRIYYMFAHSDAVQFTDSNQWLTNTPGADDDGSGCGALLEAARILSRYQFHDTIKFAFFNAEEIGLVGSTHYAENMSKWAENVVGSIDYDMIGYAVGEEIYDLTLRWNSASAAQGIYELGVNTRYNIGLSIDGGLAGGAIPSDIQSFYSYGFPGVFGIEYDFSPYYHSTSDLVIYLNFTLIQKCTKLAVASLAEMARLIHTDLTVLPGELTVSNKEPVVSETVNITANVSNLGNFNASNVEVIFSANGEPFSSSAISVPAFGMNSTSATWEAKLGLNNITVTIDPKNEVIESNETNNSAWVHLLANDRPNPILTANPTTINTFEKVIFNGSNSYDLYGGVSEFNFIFGDGNSSGWINQSNIEHSYSDNGIFTASLIVKDIYNLSSELIDIAIQVLNRPPFANPGSNLTKTHTFVPIQFYSNASDPDGITNVLWSFGDGMNDNQENPVHIFKKPGNYFVELLVEDDDGANVTYKIPITILDRPPWGNLGVTPGTGNITTQFNFFLEITDHESKKVELDWYFGDGSSDNEELLLSSDKGHNIFFGNSAKSHFYSRPGTYFVNVVIRDVHGSESRVNISVLVNDLPPIAKIKPIANDINSFDNISFNGVDSYDLEGRIFYYWEFDDGSTSSKMAPVHAFAEPGKYNVTLTVTDTADQTDTENITVVVNNRPPVAMFKIFGNNIEDGTLFFDGSQSFDPEGDISYLWTFESGKQVTVGPVVTNTFTEPGEYLVMLKVTDEQGLFDSYQLTVDIEKRTDDGPANDGDSTNGNVNNTTKPNDKNNKTDDGDKDETGDNSFLLVILNIVLLILLIITLLFLLLSRRKSKDLDTNVIEGPPDQPPPYLAPKQGPEYPPPALDQTQVPEHEYVATAQPDHTDYPTIPTEPPEQQYLPPDGHMLAQETVHEQVQPESTIEQYDTNIQQPAPEQLASIEQTQPIENVHENQRL